MLDLGCGTGSLALSLARRPEPHSILGVDIARRFIDYAASRSVDPRLDFRLGDAIALDLPDASFDRSLSLLALNFTADPGRAIAELRRVTRPGGVVAAAVWDFVGGLVYQRIFWDTAAVLDPDAARAPGSFPRRSPARASSRRRSSPPDCAASRGHACDPPALSQFHGLLGAPRDATGPVGDYVKRLAPDRLAALEAALRDAYCCGAEDGTRSLAASAWAAKALV